MEKDYAVEVVAYGNCSDKVDNKFYEIFTFVFRGNQAVIDGYYDSRIQKEGWGFDDHQAYLDYMAAQLKARREWENDIMELLGWHKKTGSVTHNMSEFFTAILIEEVKL